MLVRLQLCQFKLRVRKVIKREKREREWIKREAMKHERWHTAVPYRHIHALELTNEWILLYFI
jgi:hypothetical protein